MGLPIGLAPEDGLPVGLQIMAPARADARLYKLGATLERMLEEKWGHTLLSQAPSLAPTEMFAATEGAV
jgi:aspartyl-tRNA(Asn)/glutamyl-tRNA(Gln) amidotransferase subunit A